MEQEGEKVINKWEGGAQRREEEVNKQFQGLRGCGYWWWGDKSEIGHIDQISIFFQHFTCAREKRKTGLVQS